MDSALIIIDMQNDYFPGGSYELEGVLEAAKKVQIVVSYFRSNNWPIIHLQHVEEDEEAEFLRPGTDGVAIHQSCRPLSGEELYVKYSANGFLETPLREKLTALGVKSVVICGAMSHMCIDATVRAALDYGFECRLVQDACATRTLSFRGTAISAAKVHGAFMQALEDAGCRVVDAADIVATSSLG